MDENPVALKQKDDLQIVKSYVQQQILFERATASARSHCSLDLEVCWKRSPKKIQLSVLLASYDNWSASLAHVQLKMTVVTYAVCAHLSG